MFKTEKILSNETIYIKVKLNSNILKRLNTYIKNKNIMMGLASILKLGPYSAGIDYNKLKGKINVDELGDTVFKEGFDDEMLKYKLGYSKDDLDIGLTSNKDLNEFQLTLRKLLKKKPKYIFKKAHGGLAGILEV